jgi:protein O-GlcNAc transferase
LKARFQQRGVNPDRVKISGPASHYRYLENYDQIDIALDTWPYNGGTTTMEALWQGVPVLTLEGDRWAARTSRTLLRRTHLADWVVPNRRAFVRQAIKLARDPTTPGTLCRLRHNMRERLRASSVCDTPALAKAMEAFYFRVAAPRHFQVKA